MAAEVITNFLPDLVTAVSDCVQSVSDQCRASGLITPTVYDKILESRETSKDKARILIQAVSNSTETDERCFELFINILEQELPYAVRDGLLEKMKREANEKVSSCTAVVPSTGDLRQIPRGELPRESVVQQTHLLGRLEEAVRQHERARVEKIFLEEKLKAKTEKCKTLKAKFQALQSETQELVTKEAAEAKSKIAACESEIENLKERVKEVEKLITEQDMQVKRGRNSVVLRTKDMFGRIAQESHATAWEKAREEMRMKEQEMSMREREYKVTIQEKDLRISELEIGEKAAKESVRTKEKNIQENELRIRELEAENKYYKEYDADTVNPSDMIYERYVDVLLENIDKRCEHKWREFCLQLGFTSKELERYTHYTDIPITSLLKEWVKWYPGDSRGSTTFPTYTGLRRALVKSGLGDVARDLNKYEGLEKESINLALQKSMAVTRATRKST